MRSKKCLVSATLSPLNLTSWTACSVTRLWLAGVGPIGGTRAPGFGPRPVVPSTPFPSRARLDDLIRTLHFALRRKLFVDRVRAQRRLQSLPVSRVERFDALFRQPNLVRPHLGAPPFAIDTTGQASSRAFSGTQTRLLGAWWSEAARGDRATDEDGLARRL